MSATDALARQPRGALSTSIMCRGLDQQHREQLFCISSMQSCRAKAAIFHQGDPSRYLFEVLEGVVKLYQLMPDGRRQIMGFVYPGQVFGLDRNGICPTTAEAVVDAKICGYPLAQLERITDEQPEFALGLLRMITNELVIAQGHMLLLGRKSAVEKIASFLSSLSERYREQGLDPALLHLPMSRADIGDYLGLTIETVSRTITRLRQAGVIAHQRHGLRILDHDLLATLADEDRSGLAA